MQLKLILIQQFKIATLVFLCTFIKFVDKQGLVFLRAGSGGETMRTGARVISGGGSAPLGSAPEERPGPRAAPGDMVTGMDCSGTWVTYSLPFSSFL